MYLKTGDFDYLDGDNGTSTICRWGQGICEHEVPKLSNERSRHMTNLIESRKDIEDKQQHRTNIDSHENDIYDIRYLYMIMESTG